MEKNNKANVAQWVDQRLAVLTPRNAWQPDGADGLQRLRERSAAKFSWKQAWTWPAATLVAAALLLFFLAAPPPRVLAQRCVDCSLALWQSLAAAPRVQPALQPESARKLAPDFSLSDVAGKPIKLSDFKGKVVLLNFWATWCGGCQTEIPWFIEFQNKYKEPGLSVIGASMDDDGWKSVTPYVNEKNVNYCIVIATQAVAKQYAVEAMPATWLIDREGKIAAIHVGLVTKSAYEAEVETLLGLKH
jgi:cytochrome c biogenesis protein CcmG/thiol:disulfide interchange protein DsbE